MAKQTFTSGQVLTAAQMTSLQSNDYNQTVSAKTANYVLVAADAGTTITMSSATATTITVNTSLFTAGDTLRIQNIGAAPCVVTAGTATVTTAGSLVIPQWGGGTLYFTSAGVSVYYPNGAGLGVVKGETSFSASSITIDNIFTGAYTNYLIKIVATGGAAVTTQLRVGGVAAATNYNIQAAEMANATAWTVYKNTAQTSFDTGSFAASQCALDLNIYGPAVAAQTNFLATETYAGATATVPGYILRSGNHSTATAYDGIAISFTSASVGTYTVYGYSK